MSELDLHALANAPHGKAAAEIRKKVDPLWGREPTGETAFAVTITYQPRPDYETWTTTVKAVDAEAAEVLAVEQWEDQAGRDDELISTVCKEISGQ